jgi:hypothetical protein
MKKNETNPVACYNEHNRMKMKIGNDQSPKAEMTIKEKMYKIHSPLFRSETEDEEEGGGRVCAGPMLLV